MGSAIRRAGLIGILWLLIVAVACAPGGAPAPAGQTPSAGPPVKIGVLTPLSPPGDAAAGQLISRGASLGADYVNSVLGGVLGPKCSAPTSKVEIVTADDAGTPEKGVAGFRKLVAEDKVVAVVGQFHSSVTLALAPVADQLQVPLFSTQSSDTRITANHYNFVFQTHTITADRAAAVAQFIKEYGFKKIAIVAENTDYGTGNTDALKAELGRVAPGAEVRSWIFDRQTADLTPLLLQVKEFGPDLIYNLGVGAPAYLIVKQSNDVGLLPATPMVISYDVPIRPEFWQNLGPQGKGIIFVAYYHPKQPLTDAGKWMQQQYEAQYREPALYSSFAAFGNVIVVAQAINQACSTKGPDIARALETGRFKSWNLDSASFPKAEGADWHRVKQPLLLVQYTAVNQPFDQATILFPPDMKTGTLQR
jgi:branched-chain amino acid transport system substrate-binding protein